MKWNRSVKHDVAESTKSETLYFVSYPFHKEKLKMAFLGELAQFVIGWTGTGANYLEYYLLSMVLNLTVGLYVRNLIFFFYEQKTRWNSDI